MISARQLAKAAVPATVLATATASILYLAAPKEAETVQTEAYGLVEEVPAVGDFRVHDESSDGAPGSEDADDQESSSGPGDYSRVGKWVAHLWDSKGWHQVDLAPTEKPLAQPKPSNVPHRTVSTSKATSGVDPNSNTQKTTSRPSLPEPSITSQPTKTASPPKKIPPNNPPAPNTDKPPMGKSLNNAGPRPPAARVNLPYEKDPAGEYPKNLLLNNCEIRPALAHMMNGATDPWCNNGVYTYELPPDSDPIGPRRSETEWARGNGRATYREGDTLVYEADISGDLGQAAYERDNWHVIWQPQGRTNGQWGAFAQGLQIMDGQLRLVGGGITNNWWTKKLASWENNRVYRVKIVVKLSQDPSKGWIDAYVDGKKVVHQFKNPSGTLNRGQPEVVNRSGLYRGVGSNRGAHAGPKYHQSIKIRPYVV